jgi:hypothetical protein
MHNIDQLPMEHWIAGYLSEANLVGPDIEASDIPDLLKGEDWALASTRHTTLARDPIPTLLGRFRSH